MHNQFVPHSLIATAPQHTYSEAVILRDFLRIPQRRHGLAATQPVVWQVYDSVIGSSASGRGHAEC